MIKLEAFRYAVKVVYQFNFDTGAIFPLTPTPRLLALVLESLFPLGNVISVTPGKKVEGQSLFNLLLTRNFSLQSQNIGF